MKKILFLVHLPPPIHGAALVGQYIKESKIINSKYECMYINISTSQTVEDIGASLKKIGIFIKLVKVILKSVKNYNPDLIYFTPNAGGKAFFIKEFLIYIFLKPYKKQFVMHYHNRGTKRGAIKDCVYKYFFRKNSIILLGNELKAEFNGLLPDKNIFICPNGIPKIQSDLSLRKVKSKVVFLYLSNLIVEKGLFDLLDACSRLRNENIDFECIIVGAETKQVSTDYLNREINARYLSELVHYLGPKYGESKIAVYNQASVFVFPTFYHNECYPLVLLEAMQFGLPCISTDVGCIPSIIDDSINGFVVSPNDSYQLSEYMKFFINNANAITKFGENAFSKYTNFYTLEKFENRICDIFDKILGEE